MLVKVTEMHADTCGNSWPGFTCYVTCITAHEVKQQLEHKVPKGLRSWHIEPVVSFSIEGMLAAIRANDSERQRHGRSL